MAGEGFTFEHKSDGPNGWAVMGTGALYGVGLVIVALALFALANWVGAALASLAQYAGIATLIVSGGQFVFMTCRGGAMIIEARSKIIEAEGKAAAMQIEAQGKRSAAKALEIEAATNHIAFRRGKSSVPTSFTFIEDDHAR